MLERDWGSTGSVPPCLQEVTLPQCPVVLSPSPHLHPVPAPGAVRCLCSGLRLHGPSLGSGSWCRGEWMCHSLSWQGTNDGRKALAVPGLPLPPLWCCWLLLPACTLARAAQPGMGAVGRPRTWGNQLRLSHVTATLGDSPVPWVKRVPTARPMARRGVLLPGQQSRGWAEMPQPQRLSVPLSPAVTSCCAAGTPPARPQGITGREGRPMGPSPSLRLGAGCLAG